jgi:hypothetical protein
MSNSLVLNDSESHAIEEAVIDIRFNEGTARITKTTVVLFVKMLKNGLCLKNLIIYLDAR